MEAVSPHDFQDKWRLLCVADMSVQGTITYLLMVSGASLSQVNVPLSIFTDSSAIHTTPGTGHLHKDRRKARAKNSDKLTKSENCNFGNLTN